MNLNSYYLEDGHSIDSVVILWIETLMTLELLRRNNIYLVELYSFDIFRYKHRESTSNNRAIIIDLTKFEEIDPDRLDLYKVVLYESVKEMAVKFKSSFYIPDYPEYKLEYKRKKKEISVVCFKLGIGNYTNLPEVISNLLGLIEDEDLGNEYAQRQSFLEVTKNSGELAFMTENK